MGTFPFPALEQPIPSICPEFSLGAECPKSAMQSARQETFRNQTDGD